MKVEAVIDLIHEKRSEYALNNDGFVEYLKKWEGRGAKVEQP